MFYHVRYHSHGLWEFGCRYLEWGDIIQSTTCPEGWVDVSQLEKREKNMPGKGSQILSPLIRPDRNLGQIIMWLILPSQSVQFSSSVVPDSLQPHGLQHTRPPCPSPTPRVYSNSCPLNRWCHPTISSSVVPFSSCLQSFPVSGSFPMSQFFTSSGQSIGSFSFSISPSS